jgi:Flp pilus assembly protein TadD
MPGCRDENLRPAPRDEWPDAKDDGELRLHLGRAEERRGQLGHAMAHYKRAAQFPDTRSQAHRRMGIVCDKLGKYTDAHDHFRKALELDPNNPELWNDLGYNGLLRADWLEAEKSLRQALAIDAAHTRAKNNLTLVMARTMPSAHATTKLATAAPKPQSPPSTEAEPPAEPATNAEQQPNVLAVTFLGEPAPLDTPQAAARCRIVRVNSRAKGEPNGS